MTTFETAPGAVRPTDEVRTGVASVPAGRPVSPRLTQAGFVVVVVGFFVVFFTWGEVAGLDNVALQMPYLVSGGAVGLGTILTGLTMVIVNVFRHDAARRDRQLEELHEALGELRVTMTRRALDDDAPDRLDRS